MKVITGKLPKAVASLVRNNDFTKCIAQGSEVDVQIKEDGVITSIYAIPIGGNRWEVVDIDDGASMYPGVEKGDITSTTELAGLLSSGAIFSWNPLGAIGRPVKKLAKKVGKFISDKWDAKDFTKWLSENVYKGGKVEVLAVQEVKKGLEGRDYAVEWKAGGKYVVAKLNVFGKEVEVIDNWSSKSKEAVEKKWEELTDNGVNEEDPYKDLREDDSDVEDEEAKNDSNNSDVKENEKEEEKDDDTSTGDDNNTSTDNNDDEVKDSDTEDDNTSTDNNEEKEREEDKTEDSDTTEEEEEDGTGKELDKVDDSSTIGNNLDRDTMTEVMDDFDDDFDDSEVVSGTIKSAYSEAYWEGYKAWPSKENPYKNNPEHDVWERGRDFREKVALYTMSD